MKRFTILATIIALVGCSHYEDVTEGLIKPSKNQTEFYASMPECDTRTYVEDNKYLRWNAEDEISIFAGNSYNSNWQFAGEDGVNSGKFNEISNGGFVTGTPLDLTANYAIYPYDENITITESGVISLTLPPVQEYNCTYANSFGAGANTMIAVTKNTSDNFLAFKNLCGYLKLKFYGNDVTVKSITIKGNNGEKIAGKATVTMAYGSEPTITMADDATDTITIDCGEGVALSNDAANPTTFWVVIPEITFEGGITIKVTDINDQTFEKKTTNAVTIENNFIQPMATLEVECVPLCPANNEIWYTSSDNNVVTPYRSSVFGATIVSNIYANGKGVITFDGDVAFIGSIAFSNRTKLTSITLGNSVTEIGYRAFSGCDNLTSINIPDVVASIGIGAFEDCNNLKSITIGNGVTSIGNYAFRYCGNLVDATIGDSVNSIGIGVFSGCNSLTMFNGKFASDGGRCLIKDNTMVAYANASGTTYTIPASVVSIGDEAFSNCNNLINVTIPNGVMSIGNYTFSGCNNLTNVSISGSVASIGNWAFHNCNSLTSIIIPDGVTSIGKYTFSSCRNLTDVKIGNDVTVIGDYAFDNCQKLSSITIGNSVASINSCAFSKCSGLASVNISDLSAWCRIEFGSGGASSNPCWKGAKLYLNGVELTDVTIPSDITEIKDYAFFSCSSIINVTIPENVTSIGDSAFSYCGNLQKATIDKGVTTISEYVFYRCYSLTSVYCKSTIPPKGGACAFDENASERKIYVPASDDDSIINSYLASMNRYADSIVEYEF